MNDRAPRKIAVLYFFVGTAWIIISDYLVELVFRTTPGGIPSYISPQTLKGVVFVAATTLLLYLVLRRYTKRQTAAFNSREAALLQAELSIQQRKDALHELHHRVKNNLQLVISMLRLSQSASESTQNYAKLVDGLMRRVQTMALSHEHIYTSEIKSDVQVDSYLYALVHHVHQSDQSGRVQVTTRFDQVVLPIDLAVPCGLAVSELVSNALEHAYGSHKRGELSVSAVRRDGTTLEIRVSDNGSGLPENFHETHHEGLGLQLVEALVGQLSGQFEIGALPAGVHAEQGRPGTEAFFSFPLAGGHVSVEKS